MLSSILLKGCVACVIIFFLLILYSSISFYVYATFCFFILSVDEYLGCFFLFVVVNNAAGTWVYKYVFWDSAFSSGYLPRNGIVGSPGNSIFNYLRTCHKISQMLHHFTFLPTEHQVLISSHTHQHCYFLLFFVFDDGCEVMFHVLYFALI